MLKANCLPEMKKDRVYRVCMALTIDGYDSAHAKYKYPAGRGPHSSCKHICALCYVLVDFCRLVRLPDFRTCTDQLQQWNQPRGRRVDLIPVDKLGARRRELLPQKDRAYGSLMIFDPRPPSLREADPKALEEFRCDLLVLAQPCGFVNTSFHLLTKLNMTTQCPHGQRTEQPSSSDMTANSHIEQERLTPTTRNLFMELVSKNVCDDDILEMLCLTLQKRAELEEQTRKQDDSHWHDARQHRITGSKCGRILLQKKTSCTSAILYLPQTNGFSSKAN